MPPSIEPAPRPFEGTRDDVPRDNLPGRPRALSAPRPSAPVLVLARHRRTIVAGYAAVVVGASAWAGPPERPVVLLAVLGLALLTSVGNPSRSARFVLDWLPILVIATGYDLVRSQAPSLIARAVVEPQLRFDEVLFGGTAPTVVLQRVAFDRGNLHPWDYGAFVFYLSHFVVTPVAAVLLYRSHRTAFRVYARLILLVSLAGFVTYLALPAVPPWMASRDGALEPTARVVHSVWHHLGATGPAKVFAGDAKLANPVAALPSLHAAWPGILLLFAWRRWRRLRFVILGYTLVMALVLVYGSEHYVSDILLGWLYAAVVFALVTRVPRARAAWQRRAVTAAPPPAG